MNDAKYESENKGGKKKMGKRLVTDEHKSYPIQPILINTNQHFFDAFGNMETEISARWVVRFCQEKGGWFPFTYDELDAFYRGKGLQDGFTFNRLHYGQSGDFIVKGEDGRFRVTHEFITLCFSSSPSEECIR